MKTPLPIDHCCEQCGYYSALAHFCMRRLETHRPEELCDMLKYWEDLYGEAD